MIRKADGTVMSRITVTATTNRAIARFATMMSITGWATSAIAKAPATVRTASSGTTVNTTFPGKVNRLHVLPTTVMPLPADQATTNCLAWRTPSSLVDPAHDRVEAGHDRHRVGDQVALHQQPDRLQMDVRRVMDPHPEGLIGAVADDVRRVLSARAFDRRVGTTGAGPQQPRQLGDYRAVRHLVQALVDDPQALLDLFHPKQVAREAVALVAGRDVEVE